MEIVYKKLTEEELETFIDMRIRQLTEEYASESREVPENVELRSALFGYYRKHMYDGTFVSWLAMDGNAICRDKRNVFRGKTTLLYLPVRKAWSFVKYVYSSQL